MKKLIVSLLALGFVAIAKADLLDQVNATLIDHVETTTEFTSHGKTQLSLLDSVIQVGHFNNGYIAALDLGFEGNAKPEAGQRTGINYTSGVKLHLAPFIRKFITFSDNWRFLNALEVNPRYSYDFTRRHSQLGVGFALAFSLNPQQ